MSVRLGDHVRLLFGYAFKSSDFSGRHSDIRLLRGDNVAQGRLRWENAKRYPSDDLAAVQKYELKQGDVVLAMDRPWIEAGLKYAVIRESDLPALLVQRVARIRATAGLDQNFLGYLIGSQPFTEHVRGVQTGSAVPHISGSQIAGFRIPRLPNLWEQRGTAATLGALDDKIESNRRIVLVAEDELTALSELSAHADSRRVELGESVVVVKDAIQPTVLGRNVVEHFSLPAFDASAMPDRVTADTVLSNKLRVPGPCILLSRLNPQTDRTWYVEPDRPEVAMASTEFLVLTARSGSSIGAVWLALRAPEFRASLIRRVTGTSGSHQRVKPADVLSIETLDARSIDAASWMAADQLLAVMHQRRVESQRLRTMRDALLPELLSGRLRVPEAREAVAEVVDA